jgi:hypothetical protein
MSASKGIVLSIPASMEHNWPEVLIASGFSYTMDSIRIDDEGDSITHASILRNNCPLKVIAKRDSTSQFGTTISKYLLIVFMPFYEENFDREICEILIYDVKTILEQHGAVLIHTNMTK